MKDENHYEDGKSNNLEIMGVSIFMEQDAKKWGVYKETHEQHDKNNGCSQHSPAVEAKPQP